MQRTDIRSLPLFLSYSQMANASPNAHSCGQMKQLDYSGVVTDSPLCEFNGFVSR